MKAKGGVVDQLVGALVIIAAAIAIGWTADAILRHFFPG